MKVGFIGLGIMGKPMAVNLIKAGYKVTGYNRSSAPVKEIVKAGGIGAASVKEAAQETDVIITMLPNSPDVENVCLGKDGIINYAKKGTLLIDMSSIAPKSAQKIGKALLTKGIRMLDAPVSGGETGAINGTLSIMAGGEEENFAVAKPIFEVLGRSYVLVGPLGSGNTCKLANQIIVAANIAALSEGLNLVIQAGANPQKVFSAIKDGLAGSAVMNSKAPMMLSGDTKPGFKIDLHTKDLNNALQTANLLGTKIPLTKMLLDMFAVLQEKGMGQCDHSALFKYYTE